MPNTLLTAQRIAGVSAALLSRMVVLPRTVLMVDSQDFAPPGGGTVMLRVPVPRTSHEQTTAGEVIDFDALTEKSVSVQMRHLYNAGWLTDEDLALSLESFGRQVLVPAMAAVATGAEDLIADIFNDLEPVFDPSPEEAVDAVLSARTLLGERDVPPGDRFLAVSPGYAEAILADPRLGTVDQSGDSLGLRAATIGSLYGATVVESNALDYGTAVLYHRTAVAFGTRAPRPTSGADSSTASEAGIALRAVRSFRLTHLREAFAVSTFAGAALVTEDGADPGADIARVVKLSIEGGNESP